MPGRRDEAVIAQAVHQIDAGTYTTSEDDLEATGYIPDPAVQIDVLRADGEDFCMAAGPAGDEPTLWVTSQGNVQDVPCTV